MRFPRRQASVPEALGGRGGGAELSPVGLLLWGGSGQFDAAPGWWEISEVLEQVLSLPEWQRGLAGETHVCSVQQT